MGTSSVKPEGFISDEEMMELEKSSKPEGFISDEEMMELEKSSRPEGFISDEEMEKLSKEEEPKTEDKSGAAFTQGLLQELTFGWSDEAQAALKAGKEWALGKSAKSLSEIYDVEKDKVKEELDKLKKQNPGAFSSGEWVGLIGPMLTGVGGLIKGGAKLAGKVAAKEGGKEVAKQAAKQTGKGAGMGATAGAGFSEGENIDEVVNDALEGGLIGGAVGAGSQVITQAAPILSKLGRRQEISEIGVKGRVFDELADADKDKIIKMARDAKIITPSPEKTRARADELHNAAKQALTDFHEKVGKGNIKLADKDEMFDELYKVSKSYDTKTTKEASQLVNGFIEDVIDTPDDFEAMQQLYSKLGAVTRDPVRTVAEKQAANAAYAVVSKSMDKALDESKDVLGDKAHEAYRKLNNDYKLTLLIKQGAGKERGDAAKKSLLDIKDIGAAAIGGGIAGPIGAAKAVAMKRISEKFGPTIASRAAGLGEDKLLEINKYIQDGNLNRASVLLGVEQNVESENYRKKQTRDLLKQLKKPE